MGKEGQIKEWDLIQVIRYHYHNGKSNQIKTQIRKSIRSKENYFKDTMKGQGSFGYDIKDKKLVIHPTNSKWVEKIFDWYDKGKSTTWIRRQLLERS